MAQVASLRTENKFKKTEIGEIPVDWEVSRVENVSKSIQYGYTASASNDPIGPKLLRITDIQEGRVNWNSVPYCKCPAEIESDYLLNPGDILFARTGATTGKSYIIQKCPKAVFASYLIRILTKEVVNPWFFFYMFNSSIYWRQINQQIGGSAQGGVNASSLGDIKVPTPPLDEQKKIVEILSAVDAAIEKIGEVIEKTKQLKKALMQQLLTRKVLGGCSFVSMESLLSEFRNGYAFPSAGYVKEGIPIVTMASISLEGRFQLDIEKCNRWPAYELDNLKPFILSKGDLIISMTDVTPTKNLIGRMAIIDSEGPYLLNQRVGLLKVDPEKADKSYLAYYSNSDEWRNYCISHAALGAQANLSTADIKKSRIPLPPLGKQKKLSEILSTADEELEKQTAQKTTLENLKKGLMQVLLTGKMRVR